MHLIHSSNDVNETHHSGGQAKFYHFSGTMQWFDGVEMRDCCVNSFPSVSVKAVLKLRSVRAELKRETEIKRYLCKMLYLLYIECIHQ